MKRELKFRGISTDTGKMIEGYGVCVHDGNAVVIHKQGINLMQHTEVVPETVGQFAGLLDINGKELWEGDIAPVNGENCVLIFNNLFSCGWEFKAKMGSYYLSNLAKHMKSSPMRCTDFEIIGNIHEQPQLINPTQP